MARRTVLLVLAPLPVGAGCGGAAAGGPGSSGATASAPFCRLVDSIDAPRTGPQTIRWATGGGLGQELTSATRKSPIRKLHTEFAAWESALARLQTDESSGRLPAGQLTREAIALVAQPPPMAGTCLQLGDGPAKS